MTLAELRHAWHYEVKARHGRRRCNRNRLRARNMMRLWLIEPATTTAAASSTTTTTATIVAAIWTDATTHSFGGNTGADFDIGFFDNETAFDGAASSAAVFGSQHPFVVGFGQSVDRNDTDAIAVVAALARAKANAPFGLAGFGENVWVSGGFHGGLCADGVLAVAHFDKGVAFVFVSDAGLNGSEAAEDCTQFGFVAIGAADEEGSAKDLDVARRNGVVHVCPFGVDATRGKTVVGLRRTGGRGSALAIVVAASTATASATTAVRV